MDGFSSAATNHSFNGTQIRHQKTSANAEPRIASPLEDIISMSIFFHQSMSTFLWLVTVALVLRCDRSSHAFSIQSSRKPRSGPPNPSKPATTKKPKVMQGAPFFSATITAPSTTERTGISTVPTKRQKWGVDKDEYWFNDKIHTLGNTGFLGAIHAAMAPLATKIIDAFAYEGEDIRHSVAKELADLLHSSKARVLDLCCGVGMSTRALQKAFPDAETVIGMDTSPEMISMASFINRYQWYLSPEFAKNSFRGLGRSVGRRTQNAKFACGRLNKSVMTFIEGNAEHTPFKRGSFDLITIMYAFHEAPRDGRSRMLREARRLLRHGGILALVDISPDYKPGASMLAGEPYVLEYQENIETQVRSISGFARAVYKSLVPGHVSCWLLKRE